MSTIDDLTLDLAAERAVDAANAAPDGSLVGRFLLWVGRLPIGQKIIVFFSGNLLVALAAAAVVLIGVNGIYARNQAIDANRGQLVIAQEIVDNLDQANLAARLFAGLGDEAQRLGAANKIAEARRKIDMLRAEAERVGTATMPQLAALEAGTAQLQAELTRPRSPQLTAALDAGFRDTGAAARAITAHHAGAIRDMSQSIASLIGNLLTAWGSLVVGLCLTAVYTQYYFHRHVGRLIEAQASQLTRLVRGEQDIVIAGQDRTDEIGVIASAMVYFRRASARLAELSAAREEQARAELEAQGQRQQDLEDAQHARETMLRDLADQFERTVGEVVTGVVAASSQLQSTAALMANTAEHASSRTGEAASAMQEANLGASAAAAASDEFAMSIGEISRQAASSAELAREASVSARKADSTRRTDPDHRPAHQPACIERQHRSRPRRRGGARLCRGRQRGQGTRQPNQPCDRTGRRTDPRHAIDHRCQRQRAARHCRADRKP